MGLTSKQFVNRLFTVRNNLSRPLLLQVVGEWLEEAILPEVVPRETRDLHLYRLSRILALVGPRRAGKTYFMMQLIRSLLKDGHLTRRDVLFLDFEDYRLAGMSSRDMEEILSVFHQLAGRYPQFLFLDEVHRLPEWSRVLRTLHNRRQFRIIVSGSNSELLAREVASELRGRYEDLLLLPFSFREFLRYSGIRYTPAMLHTAMRGKILAAFDRYSRHGGFPEVVMARDDNERRRLLQGYYQTIFFKDILERYSLRSRFLLEVMMKDLLENYSSVFSLSRFEKHLKHSGYPGSKRTVANYLHYLTDAFFTIISEKFSFSPRQRTLNPKKVYLTDVGFAALGRSFGENRGRILENIVAIQLFRLGWEFFYFKDRNECDFVVRSDDGRMRAIQVCWELNERNRPRELRGLRQACRTIRQSSGIIFTYDQEDEFEAGEIRVFAVPVWKWLLYEELPA